MVSWRDPGNNAKKDAAEFPNDAVTAPFAAQANPQPTAPRAEPAPSAPASFTPSAAAPALKESVIASDLSIEGKIEGAGHVRIAGKFKGDVNVKGDLTIEQGAKLNGSVRADKVNVAGELDGNIEQAKRVDLLASSAVNGDIKADDLTIASGARLRGHVECGWADGKSASTAKTDKAGDSAAA